MSKHRIRLMLAAGLPLTLLACFGPEPDPDKRFRRPDPLDSLLGDYTGTVERSICKEPNVPVQDTCGRTETDTLSAASSRLSRMKDSLVFFLPGFGAIEVLPGDTVFADDADTIGTVSCFRIPDQTLTPGGGTEGEAGYEHAEGGAVCRDSAGILTPFTLRVKDDPHLLAGQLRTFRLQRVPDP